MFTFNENYFDARRPQPDIPLQVRDMSALKYTHLLPKHDNQLLKIAILSGLSTATVAFLISQPQRNLQKKITKLVKRIGSPMFSFVAQNYHLLHDDLKTTAQLAVLHGHSIRKTAELAELSVHQVRKNLLTLNTLLKNNTTSQKLLR